MATLPLLALRSLVLRDRRLTVAQVLPHVAALYRSEGACCLARALVDGIWSDEALEASRTRAEAAGHAYCAALATVLLRLSGTQRWALYCDGAAWR